MHPGRRLINLRPQRETMYFHTHDGPQAAISHIFTHKQVSRQRVRVLFTQNGSPDHEIVQYFAQADPRKASESLRGVPYPPLALPCQPEPNGWTCQLSLAASSSFAKPSEPSWKCVAHLHAPDAVTPAQEQRRGSEVASDRPFEITLNPKREYPGRLGREVSNASARLGL